MSEAATASIINNVFGSLVLPIFLCIGLVLIVNPDRLTSFPTQIMIGVAVLNSISNTLYAFETWTGVCPFAKVAIVVSGIYDTARHYYVYQRSRALCNRSKSQERILLAFFVLFCISEAAFVGEGLCWCLVTFTAGTYIQIAWGICSALFQFVAAVIVWQSSQSFTSMSANNSDVAWVVLYFKYLAQLYMGLFLVLELPIQICVPLLQNFFNISINPVLNTYIQFQTLLLLAESLSLTQAAERAQSKLIRSTANNKNPIANNSVKAETILTQFPAK